MRAVRGLSLIHIFASSEDKNFTYIPKGYAIPSDLDYLHITSNNTIYGTEYHTDIDSPVPLIADMSSDILSRPVDVSKYAMIYGGAQKNIGPAGVTFVIVREDALGKVSRPLPSMVDYRCLLYTSRWGMCCCSFWFRCSRITAPMCCCCCSATSTASSSPPGCP